MSYGDCDLSHGDCDHGGDCEAACGDGVVNVSYGDCGHGGDHDHAACGHGVVGGTL